LSESQTNLSNIKILHKISKGSLLNADSQPDVARALAAEIANKKRPADTSTVRAFS
jgi:hypothetical protein